jgi:hypothetical protein
MTTLRLPVAWATSANYSSGPDTGTPTKVDPSSNPEGFVNGQIIAAQHVNFELGALAGAARRALTVAALHLHEVRLEGTAITDTAESMAAVSLGEGYNVVAIKTAQSFGVSDCGRLSALGVPPSITSLVSGAAFDPVTGRILVVGTGGNRCSYSDDSGEIWTAGADIGAVPEAVVWNAAKGRFITYTGGTAKHSTTGAAAWSSGTISNTPSGGLAVLNNGDTVACGDGAAVAFSISTDGGATWADASGTIPNAPDAIDPGWVVGNEGGFIYHVARLGVGANTFRISRSADGSVWAAVKTFAMPHVGAVSANRPKVLMCQNTGLLVALMPVTPLICNGTQTMISASLDGLGWSDPLYIADAPINSFALAGGRLLFTRDAMLFASSGIGWS